MPYATSAYPPEEVRSERKACDLYEEMCPDREDALRRGREASELTIRTLLPQPGSTSSTEFEDPYQDDGAFVVNSASSAMTLASLPPNTEVYRMEAMPALAEAIKLDDELNDKFEDACATFTSLMSDEIEETGLRAVYFQATRHKIVGGNCLLQIPQKAIPRYYAMDSYCQDFDGSGNLVRIVICQYFAERALPPSFRAALNRWRKNNGAKDSKTYSFGPIPGVSSGAYASPVASNRPNDIPVYTVIEREVDDDEDPTTFQYHVWQEVFGEPVERRYKTYAPLDLPYVPMLYNEVRGESYSRGRIEEHFGKLIRLEGFSQGAYEIMAAMAKLLIFVNETSGIDRKKVEKAASGAILTGDFNKIGALKIDKTGDLSFIVQMIEMMSETYRKDVGLAFVPRRGDRVTAEEIKLLRTEIDRSLGGLYSTAAYREHRPIFYLYMNRIEARGEAPVINMRDGNRSLVRPRIITGIEALGRQSDAERLRQLMLDLQLLGPGGATIPKEREVAGMFTAANGFSPSRLLKSREQLKQLAAAIQQAQLSQQVGNKAIDVIGNVAEAHAMPNSNGQAAPAAA